MQLEARSISKRYGEEQWLFRNANAALQTGEVVGLLGPSGCGKSTFCRILAGYDSSTEGEVMLDGERLPSKGYRPVQLIFQHPERAVNPRWKAGAIMNEGWQPDGSMLESLEINPEWLNRWPSELSGGELQRICIARALAPHTRFILADEMTTMLDAITQARIWKTVLELAASRQMGLMVVSHDRHLIDRICTRVIDFRSLG
ncbi:peptide/nickel transport system ATP-binding protein [Paenibacillus phyllosphaerae]|uniref:Peptide/nickel transport system ATP-binding protein n=1 Tax=Paenibacillus phyllosphaerae TaxID=274593 RepID=A0A7W5B348_9BACL|nr:ATP-binding cassette domain-containing protein [Paenibacillus phyllosphaerae]MBB3112806.1 peptide/nickel transport system ATP-binding protein [Paenibacillus phyllosphaerae]